MKRRKFIKTTAAGAVGVSVLPLLLKNVDGLLADTNYPQAVWIENGEPAQLLQTALKEIGGMKRFVSKGDVVVIKPNIGWDRAPQFAATTNPDLVAELVKECLNAGAKTVKVFDRTCNTPRRCYQNSQIEKKAKAAGAEVLQIRDNRFKKTAIKGKVIKNWQIYKDYLEADKVINVPVAKHHSLSRVTLGLKNLMGVMGGNRGELHNNFAQKLVDITSGILPTLTVIDAYRILTDNGPVGGNLAHVKLCKTLIASPCTVSADYLALELFDHQIKDVQHIAEAAKHGLNKYDLQSLNVKRIKLS